MLQQHDRAVLAGGVSSWRMVPKQRKGCAGKQHRDQDHDQRGVEAGMQAARR